MVNVAGRSKGCTTCRQRRVKCDEHRPVCLRCQRIGLPCDGPRDLVIVHDRVWRSTASQEPAAQVLGLRHGQNGDREPPTAMPASLLVKVNDLEVSICYARNFLKSGGPIDMAQKTMRPTDVSAAEVDTAASPLFTTAFLSLAALSYGHIYHLRSITDKGLAMHSATLRKLNAALSDRASCTGDDVLLAVATLAMLEARVPTHPKSYIEHMMGMQRLLELRDPSTHRSPVSCHLYKHIRHMTIFASIRAQRSTVFAKPHWKALLRAHCSDEEAWEQELFDVLADCTVLLERRHRSSAGGPVSLARQAEIQRDALALLHQLRKWRVRWDDEKQYSYVEDPANLAGLQSALEGSTDDSKSNWPLKALDFMTDRAAALISLFNATVISVTRLMGSSQPPDSQHLEGESALKYFDYSSPDRVSVALKDQYSSVQISAALEICCCIPYVIRRGSSFNCNSSPNFHWAVTTAWMTLGRDESAAGRWITHTLRMKHARPIAQGLWEG